MSGGVAAGHDILVNNAGIRGRDRLTNSA